MINNPLGKTNIIGKCLVIKRKNNFIRKSSKSDKNVLIYVETGAGKELAASKIHELSDRRKKPFVAINWTNIPRDLFEAELFGYKYGFFTGAIKDKMGFLELAEDETIFFDEIGDIFLNLQAKLLRVIERR
jgi:transcriptional regulator with PAS, ATPase and Fis domain